jgi:hypothetical protein
MCNLSPVIAYSNANPMLLCKSFTDGKYRQGDWFHSIPLSFFKQSHAILEDYPFIPTKNKVLPKGSIRLINLHRKIPLLLCCLELSQSTDHLDTFRHGVTC